MRLLSYNIHKGIGGRDRLYRIERIIRVIEEENPDIICLQEVDRNVRRTRHDDQPSRLAAAFAAVGANYQLNVHLRHGGYGNLVLSRWPFRGSHQVSLRLRRRKPRGAQLVVVATPDGPLHLVHWHLGLGERERHWQVHHLLDHPAFRESAHLPTLVVGDFNDWRNTLAHGPFARHGLAQLTAPSEAVPLVPGLLSRDLSRQGLHPRPDRRPPRPGRPHPAHPAGVGPPAPGHRLPPGEGNRGSAGDGIDDDLARARNGLSRLAGLAHGPGPSLCQVSADPVDSDPPTAHDRRRARPPGAASRSRAELVRQVSTSSVN